MDGHLSENISNSSRFRDYENVSSRIEVGLSHTNGKTRHTYVGRQLYSSNLGDMGILALVTGEPEVKC